ncbi:MAG TPA: hypothetical protein DF383_02465 [Deltaproteobacteria bacterium]|nr:hypothetical protein [Deltaproteobacteria bacterium]
MKDSFELAKTTLFIAAYSVLVMIFSVLLNRSANASSGQLKISILGDAAEYPKTGEPFFVLSGGSLKKSFTIPLWLTIDRNNGQVCFPSQESIKAFPISSNLIYISQHDLLCAGTDECRILDTHSGEYTEPKECIVYSSAMYFHIQPLGNFLYLVYEFLEGTGDGRIVHWTPETGTQPVLEYITTFTTVTRSNDGFYSIISGCNPLTGTVPTKQNFKKISCQSNLDSCGFCIRTEGRKFKWKWKPGKNPEMIDSLRFP